MAFDFQFRLAEDEKDIGKVFEFLLEHPAGYRNYSRWVEETRAQLLSGQKTAVTAFSEGVLVGDLIYQPHKQFPRALEIKNIRVHQKLRGRQFPSFMLRQVEVDTREKYDVIVCDARSSNFWAVNFLKKMGYTPILEGVNLYENDATDIVFAKAYRQTGSGLFVPITQGIERRLVH